MKHQIRFTVNGVARDLSVEPRKTLLSVLRDQIGLTGTKEGCSTGDCGACTVLLDGKPLTSCLMLAVQADGREITTIEGIMEGGELHLVQKEMVKLGGFQCGFCTPGMIMTLLQVLERNPDPTDADVRHGIAGNLCRCTGYQNIVAAALRAAETLRAGAAKSAKSG